MMNENTKIHTINLTLPAVPNVAFKILNALNDPLISLNQIEDLITADLGLTAKILKVANSAFYGLRGRVSLISEAIKIMGFKTLKDVVLTSSIKEIYKVFGLIEKKLWEHSVGVSFVSGLLTGLVSIVKKEEASLAGLMHDVGKMILNNNFPSEYAKCVNVVNQERATFKEVEREIFGTTHQEVGGLLAEKWGFSNELRTVILNHNDMGYIKKCNDLYEKNLILVVSLADSICTRLGVGYREPKPDIIENEAEIKIMLGISEVQYSQIVNKFIDTFPDFLESFMD